MNETARARSSANDIGLGLSLSMFYPLKSEVLYISVKLCLWEIQVSDRFHSVTKECLGSHLCRGLESIWVLIPRASGFGFWVLGGFGVARVSCPFECIASVRAP
jgi:hypothetical protein